MPQEKYCNYCKEFVEPLPYGGCPVCYEKTGLTTTPLSLEELEALPPPPSYPPPRKKIALGDRPPIAFATNVTAALALATSIGVYTGLPRAYRDYFQDRHYLGTGIMTVSSAILAIAGVGILLRLNWARLLFLVTFPLSVFGLFIVHPMLRGTGATPWPSVAGMCVYPLIAFWLSRGWVIRGFGYEPRGWVDRGGLVLVVCALLGLVLVPRIVEISYALGLIAVSIPARRKLH